ncbi:hypothetical protein C8F04DRAFT_364893 [Mycena alexandri]|uniref:BTB domain-containing protein n=1 Tax=Mycena alexandri TaxID=1745969 RepID=A0AAD6WPA6_9AGAR|nr:hypothetical protein C8F04DRAFT_364893 [Mycena alexandri]
MYTEIPPTPVDELTRTEGLWFEDCGLIIQAETKLFRHGVSRDFLAMRSPVFGDMLSMPIPENAEMMEGCPFVHLPDSAKDITHFLKAMIYSEFFESVPAKTSFDIIAGVLRMSHKYEVDVLRKRALIHLSSRYPTTLHGWDTMQLACTWYHDTPSQYLEAILLARQTSALWILPIAFYCACTRLDLEDIITGLGGHTLDAQDMVACVQGVRYLDTRATSEILNFLWSPASRCEFPVDCMAERLEHRRDAEDWRNSHISPLDIWDEDDLHNLPVCDACRSQMKPVHQLARESLWDHLPAIFHLPSWEELVQMKVKAL